VGALWVPRCEVAAEQGEYAASRAGCRRANAERPQASNQNTRAGVDLPTDSEPFWSGPRDGSALDLPGLKARGPDGR
jgi:hypothetical protein